MTTNVPAHKQNPTLLTEKQLIWLEANGFTVQSALHRGFVFTRPCSMEVMGPKPGMRGLCADELEAKATFAMVYEEYPGKGWRVSFCTVDGSTAHSLGRIGSLKGAFERALKPYGSAV